MKKIVILLSLVASFCAFAGCASKCEPTQAPEAAPAHHDYKGEVNHK